MNPLPKRALPPTGKQCRAVMAWMRLHGSITDLDTFDNLRIRRLAARIYDLRALGWKIESSDEAHTSGTHARYRLTEAA